MLRGKDTVRLVKTRRAVVVVAFSCCYVCVAKFLPNATKSVPPSVRTCQDFWIFGPLVDGTDMLSRYVGKKLLLLAA